MVVKFQISIYLNNEHLHRSERTHFCVFTDINMYTVILIIDGVLPEDSGLLTFVANNEYGQASAQSTLQVHGKKFTRIVDVVVC